MRNKMSLIIILCSIVLLVLAGIKGINIGEFKILSVKEIKLKDQELNEKIEKASTLTKVDYAAAVEKLDNSFDDYRMTKEKYEQLSGFEDAGEIKKYETKQYDISYLWKVLGDHAKEQNVRLGLDVKVADSKNSLYNLNFSVSGTYVETMRFIQKLEQDSDFNFRIYSFKMTGSGTTVNVVFQVKNVCLDATTLKGGEQANTSELFNQK